MTDTSWLIDKSALSRLTASPDGPQWTRRIDRGLVRVCTPTVLEAGYSARSGADWLDKVRRPPLSLMLIEHLTPVIEQRAIEVQSVLAGQGLHRAPSVPDLLIAATAEMAGLTLLHVDKDFALIAEITGQPIERLRLAEEPSASAT